MAGNTFGNIFKVTTWGEPEGGIYGCVVDGCPAGLKLDENDIVKGLLRRFPDKDMIPVNPYGIPLDFGTDAFGNGIPIDPFGTLMDVSGSGNDDPSEVPASSSDKVTVLSGLSDGITTGAPISVLIEPASDKPNDPAIGLYGIDGADADFNSPYIGFPNAGDTEDETEDDDSNRIIASDPEEYSKVYRPGHADMTYEAKYGKKPYAGGRANGNETVARIAAGTIASMILSELGISITTESGILSMSKEGDSTGGMIQCTVTGMPAGVGEPVFDKLDAKLAHAVMSIGAIKSFEIGSGGMAAQMSGSFHNDDYIMIDGSVQKETNNAGGVLGGISDGDEIQIRAAVKPAPSISLPQNTVNSDLEEVELVLKGPHTEDITEQAAIALEAMTAITLVDMLFENMHSRLSYIKDFYSKSL